MDAISRLIELCEEDDVKIIDLFPDEFTKEYTLFDSTKDLFEAVIKNYAKNKLEL